MAEAKEQAAGEAGAAEEVGFLDQAIAATSYTPPDATKEMLSAFTEQALEGSVVWDRNLTQTIESAVAAIDAQISQQLSAIMHADDFRELEGSWRGLNKLVKESETGSDLKIRVFDVGREELLDQFESAPAIDRSLFFNKYYQHEFGTAGGEPYGALIGDFYFSHDEEDVALLRYLGEVCASSHCPFITGTSPKVFEYSDYQMFNEGRPVAAGFDAPAYASWNAFRGSEDSRYICMTLPKTLARLPYGKATSPVKSFDFEEFQLDAAGDPIPGSQDDFVWSNAAWAMGLNLTRAFTRFGWCTAIRGKENGGMVENLPNFLYTSEAGDRIQQCPTEVNLTDEREKELSDLGFLPLVHYKNSNYAVFMGAQTIQKPKTYTDPSATANAAISARLPYIMASSRIAHYLKVMGRDQIGSHKTPEDVQKYLSTWMGQYVNANALGDEARATHPLREAKISVVEQPGRPGSYSAVAYMRPWLQMEELTTSLRMVAEIPG
ncbi:type VI secretion system contractile sheath large subunit [Sansalvadorimonas sp. 2012CJ34-2]|uniref:Type VI secretion system contractile sheath large subunit n=1 Tax=Parendozoicomonas callyspongiae TaxID=2942213 RepID=A0ABT0PK64_9GAMM|nr:type VI secretion system contractile sheath large subunit [Sansalvadorimonas sp. 2012CJ34-2]MCL6271102.1 type VI secretion system contractile sheath large subunit [Sansalvadorimonas sp. 2012CJ34-2]